MHYKDTLRYANVNSVRIGLIQMRCEKGAIDQNLATIARCIKNAADLEKETGAPPKYVLEGVIVMKEGRLITVASGIQVMPGKKKE